MLKRRFKLIKQGLDDGTTLDDLVDVSASSPSNGEILLWNGSAWIATDITSISGYVAPITPVYTPGCAFGDGVDTASVVDGLVGYVRVPYSGTITRGEICADAATTGSVAVWKAAGAIPTVANIISASDPIALSAGTVGQNTSLTGWTTTVSAGDVLGFDLTLTSGSPKLIVVALGINGT